MYSLLEIAHITNAKLIGIDKSNDWQLLTDSRNLTLAENTLFFALKTNNNNGHLYIKELAEKGVKAFVVNNNFDEKKYPNCSFIKVENTLKALQILVAHHRAKFNIPTIGITGSNGKTIVKEWLKKLLGNDENICANPKSYNSQIGVPFSVWQLNANHTLGIFEAGISKPNEMGNLEAIIQPTIGILTNIGSAHDEGFADRNEKIKEKLKLFKNCEKVLMKIHSFEHQLPNIITYDFNNAKADLNIIEIISQQKTTVLNAIYKDKNTSITIPFTDDVAIENVCICWLTALELNKFDAAKFLQLEPIKMRLELKQAINNCTLINDSYSNDLNALTAAFSFLKRQTNYTKTTVILSEFEQSALSQIQIYNEVNQLLIQNNITRFICIGKQFKDFKTVIQPNFETHYFETTTNFLSQFDFKLFSHEAILLKGARSFKFETIAQKLEKQLHGTILEINLTAAQHNLEFIKSKLPNNIKIMAMVKAFAYGSGSFEMAKMLQQKVDYLAVAYTDEGITLRNNGVTLPIMVLNAEIETFENLLQYQLEPVVYSQNQFQQLADVLDNKKLNIHIEIDTGMHRLGFHKNSIEPLTDLLLANKNIVVKSIFSHLAASDEKQFDEFTQQQFNDFESIANQLETTLNYSILKHISNTAATLRFKQEKMDMVRLGIGLYGIDPSGENQQAFENVFTLKTAISQIKTIAAKESVGYARKSIKNEERKIAILAIGYADGLNRLLSNGNSSVEINGSLAPIVGNICMDMCMVDITHIDCNEGDEAIIFGKQHSVLELAAKLNTIPYEILTAISQRVKRVYISE